MRDNVRVNWTTNLAARAIEGLRLQREGFGLLGRMGPSIVFRDVNYQVLQGVFIPQPVSEALVDVLLKAAVNTTRPTIVDVGTGCGAIAISFANERPDAKVLATDVSNRAIRCARRNASTLGARSVEFMRGSLLRPVPKRYMGQIDAIASNLPYVPADVGATAPAPSAARTYMSRSPLELPTALAQAAQTYLVEGGSLFIQIFESQLDRFLRATSHLQYRSRFVTRPTDSRSVIVTLVRERDQR